MHSYFEPSLEKVIQSPAKSKVRAQKVRAPLTIRTVSRYQNKVVSKICEHSNHQTFVRTAIQHKKKIYEYVNIVYKHM